MISIVLLYTKRQKVYRFDEWILSMKNINEIKNIDILIIKNVKQVSDLSIT